tara:strand:+ start:352 stop:558 length:207 start_codon:yes stop_codon:yes gene_type:complete
VEGAAELEPELGQVPEPEHIQEPLHRLVEPVENTNNIRRKGQINSTVTVHYKSALLQPSCYKIAKRTS